METTMKTTREPGALRMDLDMLLALHFRRTVSGLRAEGLSHKEALERTRFMSWFYSQQMLRDRTDSGGYDTPICVHEGMDHWQIEDAFYWAEQGAKRLLWWQRTRAEQAARRALHAGTIEEHRAAMDAWTAAFDHWAIAAGPLDVRREAREAGE